MASSRSRIAEVLSHLTHSLVLIEDLFQTLVELLNDSPAEHRPLGLCQLGHRLSQCLPVDPELTSGLSLEVTPPAANTRHPFRYKSSLGERQPLTRRRHGEFGARRSDRPVTSERSCYQNEPIGTSALGSASTSELEATMLSEACLWRRPEVSTYGIGAWRSALLAGR